MEFRALLPAPTRVIPVRTGVLTLALPGRSEPAIPPGLPVTAKAYNGVIPGRSRWAAIPPRYPYATRSESSTVRATIPSPASPISTATGALVPGTRTARTRMPYGSEMLGQTVRVWLGKHRP